jgi:hypothetical protein
MSNPQVFQLISRLTKTERYQIDKYLRSPFVTSRRDIPELYQRLVRLAEKKQPFPDRKQLFEQLYPDKPFKDTVLRNCMSDLKKHIEAFLVRVIEEEDPVDQKLQLAEAYRRKNLTKAFFQHIHQAERQLQKETYRNPDYFRRLLDCQTAKTTYLTQTKRTEELELQLISDTIDQQFLLQKLRHACTLLTHQRVYQKQYRFGLLQFLLGHIEEEGFLEIPSIALYYYCYQFLSHDRLDDFYRFQRSIFDHASLFPPEEMRDLYLLAINFCIRKLNAGDESFASSGLDLYRQALKAGLLLENGRLSRFTFNNIVAFAMRSNALDWLDEFLEDYESYLEPRYRESTIRFNQARLAYVRKDYDRSAYLLQTTNFKDLVNSLIAKTTLLKIYYEQHEWDVLENQIERFKNFIRRRELSDYHQQNYRNILRYLQRLTRLLPGDKEEKDALRREVQESDILSEKEWFLKMLD